jgi:ABC-type oligopeptide transport system substrate-binding subunit
VRALLLLVATVAAPASTLHLAERAPPTVDPALARSPDAQLLQNAICDRLYTLSVSGKVVPQIALGLPRATRSAQRPKQWTTYTVKLSPRYRFSDGTPVTAYSFAEAFARDANPDVDSPALSELRDVVGVAAVAASEAGAVSGVRARDATTLEITTMRKLPKLAELLAQPYFCPVLEGTPDAPGGVTVPPAAGPYFVAENVPGRILLRRNRFYGGTRKVHYEQIELLTGVGFDTCRGRVRTGAVDVCLDALPQHAARADLPGLAGQGWISKRVGCLAWLPAVRLDLATLC